MQKRNPPSNSANTSPTGVNSHLGWVKRSLLETLRIGLDILWLSDLLDGVSYLRHRFPQIRPTLIVEVGARFGEDTLLLAATFPSAQVVAFECNPPALALAKRNLSGNPRIKLVGVALGAEDSEGKFYSIGTDANAGASSLLPLLQGRESAAWVNHGEVHEEVVTVRRLAGVLRETALPAPDLLWLDVEGAELKVLDGASDLLDKVQTVYTEVTLRRVRAGQATLKQVKALLAGHGLEEQRPWIRVLKRMVGGTTVNVVFARTRAR